MRHDMKIHYSGQNRNLIYIKREIPRENKTEISNYREAIIRVRIGI